MKIDKLYTLLINPSDANSAFVKHVLVDQDAIMFRTRRKEKYLIETDEKFPYIAGIESSGRRYSPNFAINKFDKKFLQDAQFYRTPKLDLPQIKMQLIKDKYNVKVIRDKNKADYIITSDKYLESLTEYFWYDCYPAQDVKHGYLPNIKGNVSEFIYNRISEFIDYVISQNGFIYIDCRLPYSFNSTIKANFSKVKGDAATFNIVTDSESLNFLLDNSDKLVKDSDIINYCNEDSVVLTSEECKSISQMIKSGDKDTMSLALEMMANCNIEKSYDKLACIFAFYKQELGNASNWNNVNVKSLKKQLDKVIPIEGYNGYGFNELVRHLHLKDKLTPFAIGVISNKMCKTILSHVGLTNSESVFDIKPKDLKLKSEYIKDLPF